MWMGGEGTWRSSEERKGNPGEVSKGERGRKDWEGKGSKSKRGSYCRRKGKWKKELEEKKRRLRKGMGWEKEETGVGRSEEL